MKTEFFRYLASSYQKSTLWCLDNQYKVKVCTSALLHALDHSLLLNTYVLTIIEFTLWLKSMVLGIFKSISLINLTSCLFDLFKQNCFCSTPMTIPTSLEKSKPRNFLLYLQIIGEQNIANFVSFNCKKMQHTNKCK